MKNAHHSVLLTGDIEAEGERQLLQREEESEMEMVNHEILTGKIEKKNNLKSSIMLVPHHGSKTSSTLEFIQRVDPEYAIIPAGYRNRYGHPKAEVVDRYQKLGIRLLNTAEEGMIRFILKDQKEMELPYRFRKENQKFWNLSIYK